MNNDISEFYKALNNIIENENDNEKNNVKCCLISNEPLEKEHITLICNHSFNYNDIFNEIRNQKKNVSYQEITRLKIFQIKCPYCRNVQDGLLPYFKHLNLPKIHGVNFPERMIYNPNKC